MIQFCLIQYDIVSYDVVSYILFHDTIWYCIKARNNIYYFDKRSLTMIYIYYDQGGFRFYKGDAFSRRAFWSVIIHVSVWYRIGVYMYQNLNTLWFCLITFLVFFYVNYNHHMYFFIIMYIFLVQLCFGLRMVGSFWVKDRRKVHKEKNTSWV